MKDILYRKICFDESINSFIVEARGKNEEGKKEFYENNFPLDKFLEIEDLPILDNDIYNIYIEQPIGVHIKNDLEGSIIELTSKELDLCLQLADKAMEGKYDELNKPPSTDEQVQKFIEEFFTETEEEPIQQKDLLAEFFAELEEEESKD